jgi:hypothetical protein
VLTREKNSNKETLVYSKNQARPSLPFSLRITGPVEAEWYQDSAWEDLMKRLESELEEKALRYKFAIKTRPQLEWTWSKESGKGGTECTILAHIDSGISALSIQNKRHLHWKVLDNKLGMGNEVEFAAPAHNLLMKTGATQSEYQETKNRTASTQASPQAARKKRYTKLDFATLASPETNRKLSFSKLRLATLDQDGTKEDHNPSLEGKHVASQKDGMEEATKETGSIGTKAARNSPDYA